LGDYQYLLAVADDLSAAVVAEAVVVVGAVALVFSVVVVVFAAVAVVAAVAVYLSIYQSCNGAVFPDIYNFHFQHADMSWSTIYYSNMLYVRPHEL